MYTLENVQNDRTFLDFWFINIIQYIKILYILEKKLLFL